MVELTNDEIEKAAKARKDCRLCIHYNFDRDIEIETFDCGRGYFHFEDYGSKEKDVGEMHWFGCNGEAFELSRSTRFWNALEEIVNADALKEKRSLAFKSVVPSYLDEQGRQTIFTALEDGVIWNVRPSREEYLSDVDKIAAFSFGFGPAKIKTDLKQYNPQYFYPGRSNVAIANIIKEFLNKKPDFDTKDIYAQWEIADSLRNNGIEILEEHIAKPLQDNNYLGTADVARMFLKNGLNIHRTIAVFAHPMHLYRCIKTLEKISIDKGSMCRIFVPNCDMVPFDENSIQAGPQNINNWIIHELSSRAYARLRGEM